MSIIKKAKLDQNLLLFLF